MPGPGNPVFSFRLEETRARALREVSLLCGYEYPGDLIREILEAVMDRNIARLHGVVRRIDKRVGVQLDLELMSKPGGPVLPRKRASRAIRHRERVKGGAPP